MFILITGKPRSGKSYYAVDYIEKNRHKFHKIYSDINGLKMKGNIEPLNFKKLMEIITNCKDIYDANIAKLGENKTVNNIDKDIIDYLLSVDYIKINENYTKNKEEIKKRDEYSKTKRWLLNTFSPLNEEQRYFTTLLLIDEAQNHFPSQAEGRRIAGDDVILWWISYHGHLYQDVMLLSQNYHKINASYIYDIEYFLDAQSSSRNILGNKAWNFTYKHYLNTPFNKTNFVTKIKIKKRKKVFALYESGDKVRTKSVVLPFLILAGLGLIAVILMFKYIASTLAPSKPDKSPSAIVSKQPTNQQTKDYKTNEIKTEEDNTEEEDDRKRYIEIECISKRCKNKSLNITFNRSTLRELLKTTKSKRLSFTRLSESDTKYSLLVTDSFINLFKGAENETNDISDGSFFNN